MIEVGQKFGKYRLLDRLAVGGMAEIFKAVAPDVNGRDRIVAIKRLHRSICEDPDLAQMLVDEARISVMLSHPNIAEIFDLGAIDGQYFIVMTYIDGVDGYDLLEETRRRREFIPIPAAIQIISDTLGALDYAHKKASPEGELLHIVHRDVSPQNIMVGYDGQIRLVDFGIARAKLRAETTQAGVIKGKFYYMSPEQATGGAVDARSDVYSAAMVLYEMLTARSPYQDVHEAELLYTVRAADIPAPSAFRADLDPELERIIMTALQRDPARRFQSAQDFRYALDDYARRTYPPVNHKEQMAHFVSNLFGRPVHDEFQSMAREQFNSGGDSMIFARPNLEAIHQFRRDRDAAHSQGNDEKTEIFDPNRFREKLAEYDDVKVQADVQTRADLPSMRRDPHPPRVSALPAASAPADESSVFAALSSPPGLYAVIGVVALLGVMAVFAIWQLSSLPSDPVQQNQVSTAVGTSTAVEGGETQLALNSDPPNAAVTINGKQVGSTPLSVPVKIGNTYQIKVSRDGFETVTKDVVATQELKPIEVKLVGVSGVLKIASYPADALIAVNGEELGKAPVVFRGLEAGKTYEVSAALGKKKDSKKVKYQTGDEAVLEVMFEFEKAPELEEVVVAAQEVPVAAPKARKVVRRPAKKTPTKKTVADEDDGVSPWGDSGSSKKEADDDEGVSPWGDEPKKKKKKSKKVKKAEEDDDDIMGGW